MKLFLTIFGAILAAAAVIGSVRAWSAHAEKERQANWSLLESMTRNAELTNDRMRSNPAGAIENRTIVELGFSAPKEFAAYSEKPLPDGKFASLVRSKFVASYQTAIEKARKEGVAQKNKDLIAWADEMEKRLKEAFPDSP